ncbi:hypothetical protein B0T16DRAFT_338528, partial [Cercophora newfieldiana]
SVAILDLGFGCGDQTWELGRLLGLADWGRVNYVGLTLNASQFRAAAQRCLEQQSTFTNSTISLFNADAASWSPDIHKAVESLADESGSERWLLALDCLYHFSPSRRPIFQYASRKLDASIATFDLILNGSAPFHQKLITRVVGVLMGCTWRAFLTEEEYVKQLVGCGYERERITIRDVSDDVFPGLVGYLGKQDGNLAEYGISLGSGFRLARKVFAWFERTSVIRGVIVIARSNSVKESP